MNHGLLVVDVQPAYHDWCGAIARDVAKRINNTRKPTVIMWVGEDITSDTEADVRYYLHEHGARPGKLAQCAFIEKDYGFFRNWMDSVGYDRDTLITVGKELIRLKLHSSEQLDLADMLGGDVAADLAECAGDIRLPHFDSRAMTHLLRFDTCGGGAEECLAEIELLLEMQGKPYTQLTHLTY